MQHCGNSFGSQGEVPSTSPAQGTSICNLDGSWASNLLGEIQLQGSVGAADGLWGAIHRISWINATHVFAHFRDLSQWANPSHAYGGDSMDVILYVNPSCDAISSSSFSDSFFMRRTSTTASMVLSGATCGQCGPPGGYCNNCTAIYRVPGAFNVCHRQIAW